MKKVLYYITLFFLIGGSTVFLSLTIVEISKNKAQEESNIEFEENRTRKISVNVSSLFAGLTQFQSSQGQRVDLDLTDQQYLVLFILTSKVCSPCISEVHEFIRLFRERLITAFYPTIIVADNNLDAAHYFLEVTDYEVPSFMGIHEELDELVYLDEGDGSLPAYQLMVIIDLKEQKVVQREILATRVTSESTKIGIINSITGILPYTSPEEE